MRGPLQERYQVYVVSPAEDPRLAVVAPGEVIKNIQLRIDPDAPFLLRRRGLRQDHAQNNLPKLKTRWTGPTSDYRSEFILESLIHPYYGEFGNPKPVSPEIVYPPGSILSMDAWNTGDLEIDGLTFYWLGVNLYPWGVLPAPSYPSVFAGETFSYPFVIPGLATPETRHNVPFTVKPGADFVIRAAQAGEVPANDLLGTQGRVQAALDMFIILRDHNGMPYSSVGQGQHTEPWVDINVMFGMSKYPNSVGNSFGVGPGSPGLIYPEIYLPSRHQLLVDVLHICGGPVPPEDLVINFIGAKIWKDSDVVR